MLKSRMKAPWITERFPPDRGGVAVAAGRQAAALAPHVDRLDVLRLDDSLPSDHTFLCNLCDAILVSQSGGSYAQKRATTPSPPGRLLA